MTIALRQYKKVYSDVLLEFLKEGNVPSHEDIVFKAGADLPVVGADVAAIFKYRQQATKSVFDIAIHNKSIKDIDTDLTILYEELIELESLNINKVLYADLFHSVHIHELNKLNKQLDSLLFAIDGGEENFSAQFESFDDLTKTNQTLSDSGTVDLNESAIVLPISLKGSFKIPLTHLSNTTLNIKVSPEDSLSSNVVSGTKAGNMFSDSVLPWAFEVIAAEDTSASVEFTFKLSKEEFINRLTLTHHGEKEQTAFVRTSVDNVNKKDLIEYSQGVVLKDQSHVVSLDFEDRLVEFIHVRLTKEVADSALDDNFQFIFGLKNISLFTTGRQEVSQYISKPFDFSDVTESIGKISINATELLPENTSINWFIGVTDTLGDLVGSYMAISPINGSSKTGVAKVISLSNVLNNENQFITSSSDYSLIETNNNIKFYNIFSGTKAPVYGSALLYRGYRSWLRDQTKAVNPVLIKDNFIPFSKSDIQQLYQIKQEVLSASKNGETETVIVSSKSPLYDINKGHTFIPAAGFNPSIDTDPIYAIYSAKLAFSVSSVTLVNKTFSSGGIINLGIKNIQYTSASDIIVKDEDTDIVYTDGYDYIVELDDSGNPTGKIIALEASENDTGPAKILPGYGDPIVYPSVSIAYSVDPDVTRFIIRITGNQVFFEMNIDNLPGSQIIVKYRHQATEVIKSSIKVKAAFGAAGNAKIFTQGQDYIYDSTTANIQKLSTGQIGFSDDVYIDYKYNDLADQLDQFFLWAYVDKDSGINIVTQKKSTTDLSIENKLTPNSFLGEEFLAQIPKVGLVSLTDAVDWPEMSGWIQFIVKSVAPEDYIPLSGTPLIDQVIQMKDEDGDFIFIQDGKYFKELTAIKEPMVQVSYNYLKNNTLKKDDKLFAIKEVTLEGETTYQTVVNFEPNNSTKLYSFSAVGDGYTAESPAGIYPINESWKLVSTSKDISAGKFQKVIVKAILSRLPDASGGNITPKAFDYFIKIGN